MTTRMLTLICLAVWVMYAPLKGQRLYISIDNGVSIPIGMYKHPDFYFQGGEAAGIGYNGQIEATYKVFEQFGISAIGGIQTNPYRIDEIRRYYEDISDGMLINFAQRGYQVQYGAIGPQIKIKTKKFHIGGTVGIGQALIEDNFIKIDFKNSISDRDAFMSNVFQSKGSIMIVKGFLLKPLNPNLALGLSVSHIRGAFTEVKSYFFFREDQELEKVTITDKVQPSAINLSMSFLFKL